MRKSLQRQDKHRAALRRGAKRVRGEDEDNGRRMSLEELIAQAQGSAR